MRRWIIALCALAVAGLVLLAVGGATLDPIGFGLVGIATVGAVSLGFYAVGRSEDRAREAEAKPATPESRPDTEPSGDGRINSRRPPRSRGDS
jgi:hypothetical protein